MVGWLCEWARVRTVPIIAVGYYNFDYDFATRQGNESFVEFMRDGVWKWIEPIEFIDTNWADRNKDGVDDYPGSMLDFVFVAHGAKEWKADCRILVADDDFPDDEKTSDHRPVELTVELNSLDQK
jgi:exonuclease III